MKPRRFGKSRKTPPWLFKILILAASVAQAMQMLRGPHEDAAVGQRRRGGASIMAMLVIEPSVLNIRRPPEIT
jgi:hypothetical protein